MNWRLRITLLAVLALIGIILLRVGADAHEAPSGWAYPEACCSGQDCAPVRASAVREIGDGYHVELGPADHPILTRPMAYDVVRGDDRIRQSPDGDYHACVSGAVPDGFAMSGPPGHILHCLFVPPKLF